MWLEYLLLRESKNPFTYPRVNFEKRYEERETRESDEKKKKLDRVS